MKKGLWVTAMLLSMIPGLCQPVSFEQITGEEGLSHNDVNCVVKDSEGFMWFGTDNGLNRYDGYTIREYQHDPEDSTTISGKGISCLFEDSRGNLWAGTSGEGLNRYRRETDDFIRFTRQEQDTGTISHNWIMCMFEDSRGRLWIGTQNGLNRYDYSTGTFTWYLTDIASIDMPSQLRRSSITDIGEDSHGNLWITTWVGLHFFNPDNTKSLFYSQFTAPGIFKTDRLESLYIDPEDNLWIGARGYMHRISFRYRYDTALLASENYRFQKLGASVLMIDIEPASEDRLWLGTGRGLALFDKKSGSVRFHTTNPRDPGSLSSNLVNELYIDNRDMVWVATTAGGVNVYHPNRRKFRDCFPEINQSEDGDKRFVKSVYRDHNGMTWIGTDYGLFAFNRKRQLQSSYVYNPADPGSIGLGGVSGLAEDTLDRLWVSNWGGGLSLFDRTSQRFTHFRYTDADNFNNRVPGSNAILCMTPDHSGNLWMGTGNGYLDKFNPYTQTFTHHFIFDEDSLRGIPVVNIAVEPDGTVWAAANPKGGLYRLDPGSEQVTRYSVQSAGEKGLTTNEVYAVEVDSDGVLWIGTDEGLFRYYRQEDRFERISGRRDLPSDPVLYILEDAKNTLWLSTLTNLVRFRKQDTSVVIFDESDGLPLASTTGYLDSSGRVYLGGKNGIIRFRPGEVTFNTERPPVVLTRFLIRNEPVDFRRAGAPYHRALNRVDTIQLRHEQNYFSFEFAALNYAQPERNRYAYKLEGFDEQWNYVGTRRRAYYTNVPPGRYTFHVIGSNNNGIWNREGTSVQVLIKPPWYLTPWAIIAYGLIFIVVLATIVQVTRMRERLRSRIALQQVEMEKQKSLARKERELAEYKLRFFTNISHEFRTPLTLIRGPLEKLYRAGDDFEQQARRTIPLVHRNAQRLLILIEQLLTFRRINQSKQQLNATRQDLVEFTRGILRFYEAAGNENALDIRQDYPGDPVMMWFDPFQMEQVLHNLFSNSFKYAPEEGTFRVSVETLERQPEREEGTVEPWVKLTVFNTSAFMDREQMDRMFERFYRADDQQSGTGIGLSVAKSLVELHHGEIGAEYDNAAGGVRFTVLLPQDDRYLEEGEKSDESSYSPVRELDSADFRSAYAEPQGDKEGEMTHEVLVVEDNRDLRDYLSGALSDRYRVFTAVNGEEGLRMAEERVPDIIVSDVKMPVKDGYALVKEVKDNYRICHIPVILLTARTTDEDKITGYESGADAYVEKPFNLEVLAAQIRRSIRNREIMQQNFREWVNNRQLPEKLDREENAFVERIHEFIEEHIDQGDISVKEMAGAVSLSTTQIYRKVKALTGYTPVEYIRFYKLSRAQELLRDPDYSVKQVAYMSGFNDPSYFGKCFKGEFGLTPQEFREQKM